METRIFGNGIQFDQGRLRRAMSVRATTGKQLAEVAGVTGPTVSQACLGRVVSATTAGKIARALALLPILLDEDLLAAS